MAMAGEEVAQDIFGGMACNCTGHEDEEKMYRRQQAKPEGRRQKTQDTRQKPDEPRPQQK